jgi:hypothetical protein
MAKKKTRDEQFIEDLFGYMIYCSKNDVDPSQAYTNLVHDVAGWYGERNEKWWSPRTTGYAKYIK